jgi:hypothetical protein
VTAGAAWFVGHHIAAKGVDNSFLAQLLSGLGVIELPGAMYTVLNLISRHVVAVNTGFGDFWAAGKWAIKLLKLAVVGGGGGCQAAVQQQKS